MWTYQCIASHSPNHVFYGLFTLNIPIYFQRPCQYQIKLAYIVIAYSHTRTQTRNLIRRSFPKATVVGEVVVDGEGWKFHIAQIQIPILTVPCSTIIRVRVGILVPMCEQAIICRMCNIDQCQIYFQIQLAVISINLILTLILTDTKLECSVWTCVEFQNARAYLRRSWWWSRRCRRSRIPRRRTSRRGS